VVNEIRVSIGVDILWGQTCILLKSKRSVARNGRRTLIVCVLGKQVLDVNKKFLGLFSLDNKPHVTRCFQIAIR